MPPLPLPPPARAGEPPGPPHGRALTLLMPTLYQRLRLLARRHLRGERSNHTLDSGALVHEAWLRLAGVPDAAWNDETHVLATAARAMHAVLVDHARRRTAHKRGQGSLQVSFDDLSERELSQLLSDAEAEQLLIFDDVLSRLTAINAVAGRLVECRTFAGMTLEEAAEAMGLSYMTARRRWDFARAWMQRELSAA